MKQCPVCGQMIPDDSTFCPLCGAKMTQAQPQPKPQPAPVQAPKPAPQPTPRPIPNAVPNATPHAAPANADIWDSMFFKILPFISAATFALGALVFLITTIVEEYFIFSGLLIFLASIAFLIAQIPGFIKAISRK